MTTDERTQISDSLHADSILPKLTCQCSGVVRIVSGAGFTSRQITLTKRKLIGMDNLIGRCVHLSIVLSSLTSMWPTNLNCYIGIVM